MSVPAAIASGIARTRPGRPVDVERDERVGENGQPLEHPAEPPNREVGRDHLEERRQGPDENLVERPFADHLREEVEVTDGDVGERERDRRERVEQRDLLDRPAAELRDVREDDDDRDEVADRQQCGAEDLKYGGEPVLELCTHVARRRAAGRSGRAQPPCSTSFRVPAASVSWPAP